MGHSRKQATFIQPLPAQSLKSRWDRSHTMVVTAVCGKVFKQEKDTLLRGMHPGLGREWRMKSWRQGFLERAVPFALSLSDSWFKCAEPGLTLLSLSPGHFWNPVPGWPAQVGCMRQALGPGALGRPRGIEWRGRWEGGSGWGTHVNLWLIHFNVWQNPLQYCN